MNMTNPNQPTKILSVKPTFFAQLCPRCRGFKSVSYGRIPCDMCEQRGYIKIPVEEVKEANA